MMFLVWWLHTLALQGKGRQPQEEEDDEYKDEEFFPDGAEI